MKTERRIHNAPYAGTNNRKHTLSRIKDMDRTVQNVPIYDKPKDHKGERKFLGYRYIFH